MSGPGLPRWAARAFFRDHVETGLAIAGCLAVVALTADALLGEGPAILAGIGGLCVSIADQPGRWRDKLAIMAFALGGTTLVTLLAGLAAGQLLATAGVVALTSIGLGLAAAFGRKALALGVSGVLALVIGLGAPHSELPALIARTELFAAGGAGYAALAMAVTVLLARHNRRMALNEALLAFAGLLRARARLYERAVPPAAALAGVVDAHGALMEKLQAAREIIFPAGTGRWIGGMIALIDAYETVLSGDADWDALRAPGNGPILSRMAMLIIALAGDVEAIALSLVSPLARMPDGDHAKALHRLDAMLAARPDGGAHLRPTRDKLARAALRMRQLAGAMDGNGAIHPVPEGVDIDLFLQARPDIARTLWTTLSLRAPVMRYTIRLTLAMLTGYAITRAAPGAIYGGWVLLTVALIMRASFAVTLQRRNDRVIGTLAGSAFAAVLIPILPLGGQAAVILLCAGISHAYASVNYRVTAFAASANALMLVHLLQPQNGFVTLRIADTLIGAGLSMAFAFVLPSWEWRDVPRLIRQLLEADRDFAQTALRLKPGEQAYRLARKRALETFTALASLTRRLASEPKSQARNLAALNALLGANYLFASDLASVQGLFRARGDEIGEQAAAAALLNAARERVDASLAAAPSAAHPPAIDTLRRRGRAELTGTNLLVSLRRRLAHIEASAGRLAAQAALAANARP